MLLCLVINCIFTIDEFFSKYRLHCQGTIVSWRVTFQLLYQQQSVHTKGRLSLFNLFIDIRTTAFFLYEMDKLTVVLMSIKWLNKKRWPLNIPAKFFHKLFLKLSTKLTERQQNYELTRLHQQRKIMNSNWYDWVCQ